MVKYFGYIATGVVFLLGFLLFYYETADLIGSLFAALCSALLVLGSFIIISWILQSMRRQ
jgi:hypothetical protein